MGIGLIYWKDDFFSGHCWSQWRAQPNTSKLIMSENRPESPGGFLDGPFV